MTDKIGIFVFLVGVLVVLLPFAIPFFIVITDISPCRLFGIQLFTVGFVLFGIVIAYTGLKVNGDEKK